MAPPAVDQLAEQLYGSYRQAWEWIRGQETSIGDDPMQWRRRARLNDLERQIASLMDGVDHQARDWLNRTFPTVYGAGAADVAGPLGTQFTWTAVHRDAMSQLAQDTFSDLLSASDHVRRSTKILVREVARSQTLTAVAAGRTPEQAAREMRALLADKGIFAVTYKDGSHHGLAEYADVVLRTKTAVAYNAGTLNQSITAGTEFFEVFDGEGCGWTDHNDSQKANGLIVSASEATDYPVAHPRCRRAFGPRPDIRSKQDADNAQPSTTPAQRRDQADFERRRTETLRRAQQRRDRLRRRRDDLAARAATRTPAAPAPAPPAGDLPSSTLSSLPTGKVGQAARQGLAAVEQLHRVPTGLRTVPVKNSTAQGYQGQYEFSTGGDRGPRSIRISSHSRNPSSTFAHEFGHYIDHQALSGEAGRWATSDLSQGVWRDWARAVEDSPTMKQLRVYNADHPRDSLTRYYLSPKEIWARSYAQWVGLRSGDTGMMEEMATIRHTGQTSPYGLSQWDLAEFEPIARAIDAIFRSKGLLL